MEETVVVGRVVVGDKLIEKYAVIWCPEINPQS